MVTGKPVRTEDIQSGYGQEGWCRGEGARGSTRVELLGGLKVRGRLRR